MTENKQTLALYRIQDTNKVYNKKLLSQQEIDEVQHCTSSTVQICYCKGEPGHQASSVVVSL